MQRGCGASRYPRAGSSPAVGHRLIANCALLLALGLQSSDPRAELAFRSAERINGQQQWSAPRRYDLPADTTYPRTLADGTQIVSEEVQVYLRGNITLRDVYAAKVMESLVKRGRQKLAGNAVSLSGNGGDVDAAMEVGRLLRRLGVSTYVAREDQCLSSCVFAFMGGDQRAVAGRIGIHRPYFSSTHDVTNRRSYYRQLQKRLQQYVEELDFPVSLYEALMAVPPESIRILSAADLRKYYLHGMSPPAEEEADALAARNQGISVLEYLQQKAQAQPCAGVFGGDGACESDAQKAVRSGATATVPDREPVHLPPVPDGVARKEPADNEGPGATLGASGPR